MQLPILVSEAEAETVICFCFRIAPDSELPAVKPERGSMDFCAWVGRAGWKGCARTVWVRMRTDDPL